MENLQRKYRTSKDQGFPKWELVANHKAYPVPSFTARNLKIRTNQDDFAFINKSKKSRAWVATVFSVRLDGSY